MNQWKSDWANDPDDDYNLVLEILCDDEDIAVIKQSKQGLFIKWYANPNDLIIPFDWLLERLLAAKEGMGIPTNTETN